MGFLRFDGHPTSGALPSKECPSWRPWNGRSPVPVGRSPRSSILRSPAFNHEGQRTGTLRFGDQRAMALARALRLVVHGVTSFTNKSLRGQVAGLLGREYSSSQMSYDLRRLRLHWLITRTPGTNNYTVTPEGISVAVFYTKLRSRLLVPPLDADRPPAPIKLRRALRTVECIMDDYGDKARLGTASWSLSRDPDTPGPRRSSRSRPAKPDPSGRVGHGRGHLVDGPQRMS